jgi:hypothetical protein
MKYLCILAAAVSLLGGLPLASAAESDLSSGPTAINAFAGPLTIHGVLEPPPQNEDLASPFVEAHSVEEYLTGAAANAVWRATRTRIRSFPFRIEERLTFKARGLPSSQPSPACGRRRLK